MRKNNYKQSIPYEKECFVYSEASVFSYYFYPLYTGFIALPPFFSW